VGGGGWGGGGGGGGVVGGGWGGGGGRGLGSGCEAGGSECCHGNRHQNHIAENQGAERMQTDVVHEIPLNKDGGERLH
jgi:hypothetical protein